MQGEHYELVSTWHLDASVERVWQVLTDAKRWPEWWPFVEAVEKLESGEPDGRHSLWRHTWKTLLPYKLRFQLRITRIEAPTLLEAEVSGDVLGRGICHLERSGDRTVLRYQWDVLTCKAWMNRLAPLARPIFLWNHRMVMKNGAVKLAAHLASREDRTPARV